MFLVGACRLASLSWCSEKIRRGWSQTPTAKHTVTDNGINKLPLCRRCSSSSPLFCDFPPFKSSFLLSLMFLYDCTSKTEYHIPTFRSHFRWCWGYTGVLILTWWLVSSLDWSSLSMSWQIILKVGLSVGSKLQQCVISWYLKEKKRVLIQNQIKGNSNES